MSRGWVFVTVIGKQDPRRAAARGSPRQGPRRSGARARGGTGQDQGGRDCRDAQGRGRLRGGGEEGRASRSRPTELIARGAAVPDIGVSAEIDKVAFALPQGGVSDPISTPQGTAIVRVVEKEDVTDAQIAAGRDQLREELVNQRRDRFFSGYMVEGEEEAEDRDQSGNAAARGRSAAARGRPLPLGAQ